MRSTHVRYYNMEPVILLLMVMTCNGLSWVNNMLNVTACKGQVATFNWLYKLSPSEKVSQIAWAKEPTTDISVWDGSKFFIPDGPFHDRVEQFQNGTLILKSSEMDDLGTYTVQLTVDDPDAGTKISSTAKGVLHVQDWAAPSLRSPPADSSPPVDGCKEFRCFENLVFLGRPPVQFQWKHDDDVINASSRGSYSYLSVCSDDDKGQYSCQLIGDALQCLSPEDAMRNPVVFNVPDPKASASSGLSAVGVGISITVGIVLLIAASLLLVVWWRRKKKQEQNYNTTSAEKEKMTPEEQHLRDEKNPEA
ncbi:uncharacterized protein LOC121386336 [Gigantopelta aegis]|uniref:uncharacterized protein LOC121386336 n=1 Tax=Gigantopelta aegis TaxID=1735272 RepID=UPI001B88E32D|nr:uncharacterized protein LOC121386336 [Gigantopelta aegis]